MIAKYCRKVIVPGIVGDLLEIVLIYSPWAVALMRIKSVVCNSALRPKVDQYFEAVLVTCVTILQCIYRFGNQAAALHCGLKKEPLKKRLTRSGHSFIKTKYAGHSKMGLYLRTLWCLSPYANLQRFLQTSQMLIENRFSFIKIPFFALLPWVLFWKFPVG